MTEIPEIQYFTQDRNIELSTLYFLETQLATDWPGTTILKTFADVYAKDYKLPIVCARLSETSNTRREVGATTLESSYLIIIDVFARSDGMRVDLSSWIITQLKDGWVHYDHTHMSGDKSQLDRVANGRDFVTDFVTNSRLEFGSNADSKDRYRQNISIRVRKST